MKYSYIGFCFINLKVAECIDVEKHRSMHLHTLWGYWSKIPARLTVLSLRKCRFWWIRHILISTVYLFSEQHNPSLFVSFFQSPCIMEVLPVSLLHQVAVETHTDSGSRSACHWRLSARLSDWLADSLMVFTYFGTNLGHLITTTVSIQRRQRLRRKNEPKKGETIQEDVNRATKRLQ